MADACATFNATFLEFRLATITTAAPAILVIMLNFIAKLMMMSLHCFEINFAS